MHIKIEEMPNGETIQTDGIVWMEENGDLIVNSKAERRTFSNIVLIDMAGRSIIVHGTQAVPSGTGEAPKFFSIIITHD